jgi:hypothetical protein
VFTLLGFTHETFASADRVQLRTSPGHHPFGYYYWYKKMKLNREGEKKGKKKKIPK